MTKDIIKDNFSKKFIDNLENAITGYKNNSIYNKILTDADSTAEIGKIGVFRLFYYNSCINKTIENVAKYWLFSSYEEKIKKAENANFEITRKLMFERISDMKKILTETVY